MAEGGSGLNIHPMEQFEVHPLFGDGPVHWYSLTNATLWMALAVIGVSLLMIWGSRGRALVPSRGQSIAESVYGFGYKMVEDVAGREGTKYFPYVMTVFLFILFANVFALIPGSFAVTSHIAVTAILALAVFFTVTAIGFYKHGAHFLNLFWVSSAPTVALRIVLAAIEVISYFVRPLSHSVRLAGNMMAGPRGAEGLRGLRRRPRHRCLPPDPRDHRHVRARADGGRDPGLRLRDPDLRLSQRRAPPRPLGARRGPPGKP